MALAPCLIGYGAIANRLYAAEETLREGNRYWKWIENYAAEDYTEAVQLGSGKNCLLLSYAFVHPSWLIVAPFQNYWRRICEKSPQVGWKSLFKSSSAQQH